SYRTSQEIMPTTVGMPSGVNTHEFGWSLAAGDVKGNGRADLVVTNGQGNGPAVILYGTSTKLAAKGSKLLAIQGPMVGLGDLNGDGFADLLAADQWYDVQANPTPHATLYRGTSTGISLTSGQTLDPTITGTPWSTSIAGSVPNTQICEGP